MQIEIQRTDLLRALSRVQGVVERRPTARLAAHVLLEATEQGLNVSATDSDISLTGHYAAQVSQPGSVTANARQLYDIVRALPADDVRIDTTDKHWLNIACASSEFHVAGGPSDEFPALYEVASRDRVSMPAATFLHMVDCTLFCVSNDESRMNLAGVFCEPAEGNKLRMVSTDGHRLALAEGALGDDGGLARGVLLPKKALVEMRRLLAEGHGEGNVCFGVHEQGMLLEIAGVTLTTRLIDQQFPDYRQVIPQSSNKRAIIDRVRFAEALKRVSLLSQSRTWGVRLEFADGSLRLAAEDPEHGDARERLDIDYDGEPLTIGFNARYILDALALMGTAKLNFALTDEHSPGVLRPAEDDTFLSIVMPMRV